MRFKDGLYHEPGVYFGMPEDEYHADYALGSTDLRNLLVSPLQYWWHSNANPWREDEAADSKFKLYGRAIHKRVLEGLEEFNRLYWVKPPPPEPGALVTLEDLRAHARTLGISTGGLKAELVDRIHEIDPKAPIHELVVRRHMQEAGDRHLMDHQAYAEIVLAAENIRKNPHLQFAFDNGLPEVSVFWDHQGVPMKARFDYLKIKCVVDLKSTRNVLKQLWPVAVANFLARGNYYIQGTAYLVARRVLPTLVDKGLVYGLPDTHRAWLDNVCAQDDVSLVFIVYQADGAPLVKGVIFSEKEDDFSRGLMEIDDAIGRYLAGHETFGSDEWVEDSGLEYWGSLDWPMWRGT